MTGTDVMRNAYRVLVGHPERRSSGDLGVDGMVILK
jgi:hypothetical protein